jgi:biotin operon repressor
MNKRCCQLCGQVLPTTHMGIEFTRGERRIFDLIVKAGDETIDLVALKDRTGLSRTAIRTIITRIRAKLAEVSRYRITSGHWGYQLVQTSRDYCSGDAANDEQQRALGL